MSAGGLLGLRRFLELIRFEHTLFALPYAVAGAFMAARGLPALAVCGWILVAMVGARTAAMTFNRLVDRRFDAANPRTARRHSVTGAVGPGFMTAALVVSGALFFYAAWRLNALAFRLAFPTLALLLAYSVTKRFLTYTHVILGVALGISPLGAWVAVRGSLDGAWPALWLSCAVTVWTAGFDILYACQDVDFDKRVGLRSVPARFGLGGAFLMARLFHAAVPVFLAAAGYAAGFGWIYHAAVAFVAALLVYEHRLVRRDDLSRLNAAFFNVNVGIAFVVLAGVLADLYLIGATS